jgi:hypothetical protein
VVARTISCPSCSAPHDIHNPGIIRFACPYCGSVVSWDEERIELAGRQSVLDEGFTRLYTGAAGSLHRSRFVVLGRARYAFERGTWDEWFVEMEDGSIRWLTEDNHELALETEIDDAAAPPFENLRPGARFELRDGTFVVEEVGEAECVGLEGDLPKDVEVGERYPYADGSSPDGRYSVGLEYDADPPTVFVGRWLKRNELKLDDEGEDW